ncbi:hypothetical protein D3C72_1360290 [compost metagenome]
MADIVVEVGDLGFFAHAGDQAQLTVGGFKAVNGFAFGAGPVHQGLVHPGLGAIAGPERGGSGDHEGGQPGSIGVQGRAAGPDALGGLVEGGEVFCRQDGRQGTVGGDAVLLGHLGGDGRIVLIGHLDPELVGRGEGGVHLVRTPGSARAQVVDRAEQIDGRVRVLDHPQRRTGALGAWNGGGGGSSGKDGRGGLFGVGGAGEGCQQGAGGQGGAGADGQARDAAGRTAHAVGEGHWGSPWIVGCLNGRSGRRRR